MRKYAHATSPSRASGAATTATSATSGMRTRISSTSCALDVLAAADDDVLLAIGDREVAVVVEHTDVAGHEPAVGAERSLGRGLVGVTDEQLRPATPDLAGRTDFDVLAVVVDETDLDAGQRQPVGGDALVVRRVGGAAGDRGVLGRAEAARDLDAHRRAPLAHRGGNRRTTEADERHQRHVPLGVVVGMVEQAREEERRTLPGRQPVVEHRLQHSSGIPHVDEVDLTAPVHRNRATPRAFRCRARRARR